MATCMVKPIFFIKKQKKLSKTDMFNEKTKKYLVNPIFLTKKTKILSKWQHFDENTNIY